MSEISQASIGSRIWFAEDKRPYTVQARDDRFLVCTKPFAAKKTVLYTIVDLHTEMRGTDGFVFGLGYETRADCDDALTTIVKHGEGISRRNCIPVNATRVSAPVHKIEDRSNV